MNEWSRLVVTYDGSSRAAGITTVSQRHARRDRRRARPSVQGHQLRREAGDRSSDTHPLTIGARFRDSGFKNGLIDDLQVFDVCLTAAEVAGTIRRDRGDTAAFAHFLARHHPPYISALAELKALREQENRLVADVPEIMVMEEMPTPRPAHLLARGAYDAPGPVVSRETPGSLPPFPERSAAQSSRPGALADRPQAPARGARRRESNLAHALRPGPRGVAGGLRQSGKAADTS